MLNRAFSRSDQFNENIAIENILRRIYQNISRN